MAVLGERSVHFGADERRTWDGRELLDLSTGSGYALEGHVSDPAPGAEENSVVFDCIQAVGNLLAHEAVCLAIPRNQGQFEAQCAM